MSSTHVPNGRSLVSSRMLPQVSLRLFEILTRNGLIDAEERAEVIRRLGPREAERRMAEWAAQGPTSLFRVHGQSS